MIIERELDELAGVEIGAYDIPVPRSGKHYELYVAEVLDGRHGCLDAPVGD